MQAPAIGDEEVEGEAFDGDDGRLHPLELVDQTTHPLGAIGGFDEEPAVVHHLQARFEEERGHGLGRVDPALREVLLTQCQGLLDDGRAIDRALRA